MSLCGTDEWQRCLTPGLAADPRVQAGYFDLYWASAILGGTCGDRSSRKPNKEIARWVPVLAPNDSRVWELMHPPGAAEQRPVRGGTHTWMCRARTG